MVNWRMNIRDSGLVERLCEHNVGHPDPDSVAFLIKTTGETHWGVHACCGCCRNQQPPNHE